MPLFIIIGQVKHLFIIVGQDKAFVFYNGTGLGFFIYYQGTNKMFKIKR
jgi:hypothetical protein